MTQVIPLTND